VEDELAVGERLERRAGLHARGRQVGEGPTLLGGQGDEAVARLDGDVEDVLEVGLLDLEPDARVEPDEVGGAVERLHRPLVEALLAAALGHSWRPPLPGSRAL